MKQTFIRHFTVDVPANYSDDLLYGFGFSLVDFLPDARNLSTIYDEYKIVKAQVTIRPDQRNRVDAFPMEVLAIDHDDSNVVNQSFVDLINYAGAKVGRTGFKSKTWKPHFKSGAVLANGNLVAAQVKGGWLDSLNTDVQHYGFKIGYQNAFTNPTAFKVSITEKIWIMYRNKR